MSPSAKICVEVVDTHTGGEPTRVVYAGGPELGAGSIAERRDRFRESFDHYRSAVVNEPRGSDVMVGALLVPPQNPSCISGVIFFNNVGYLGMCGHGTIGVAAALGFLGRIAPGSYRLETPVGIVTFAYDGGAGVEIQNVLSDCYQPNVRVIVPGYGEIMGDIAWGGNWFFLVHGDRTDLTLDRIGSLTEFAIAVKRALAESGITGREGAEIDHVELFGPPQDAANDSRSFVLCPGAAYDRSPCGTGTSAKLACLAARNQLRPGEVWRQESIVGSVFEAWYTLVGASILPTIRGTAFVNGTARILVNPDDPFAWGIRAGALQRRG